MKKVLFLMGLLLLIGLGTASVKAQVRIGGDYSPNKTAVLDLNADDSDTPAANKGGLALPRIYLGALSGSDANLNGTTPLTGMLVYNTNGNLGAGIYFWDGSKWGRIEGDDVIGNELTDTIAGGGLNKTGDGTEVNPYKVGIKAGGIVGNMIADHTISANKIATTQADSGRVLMSTGTGFIYSNLKADHSTIYRTYTLLSDPIPVMWTRILDYSVSDSIPAWGVLNLAISGLKTDDFCYLRVTGTESPNSIEWGSGYMKILNPSGEGGIKLHVIRCYRPSA